MTVLDKGGWRREAEKAWAGLNADQQAKLKAKLGYPLRIKDFSPRMCKLVIMLSKEV
jgi:hypothetical protein